MKKKNGFTLIELLAIIVILAVIAVITIPLILNVIENAEIGAAQNSAYGYKDALNKYYVKKIAENPNFTLNGTYTINDDGSISDEIHDHIIELSGTIPSTGFVTLKNGTIESGCVQINDYAVTFSDSKITNTKKEICRDPNYVEEFPQVEDTYPGIICGNGAEEDYENNNTCYINSVEDLVAFSNMVNSGKDFTGKTVELTNNIDITDEKSYKNSQTKYNDINENGTTETIIEELTNSEAKGFKPIGNNSNLFSGTFEGNGYIINNLYINRTGDDYVGLFGKNAGQVKGIILKNITVNGKEYVGGIAGMNYESNAVIKSVQVENGNISGTNMLGLIAGYTYFAPLSGIASGNIIGTGDYIGGIVGYANYGTVKGVYQGGTIEGNSNISRILGYGYTTTVNGIASNAVKINNVEIQTSNFIGNEGYGLSADKIKNITVYETLLDTYIGGNDNDDKYYYDYDRTGNITLYNIDNKPLDIKSENECTQESPCLIENYSDLKKIAYNQTKHFKLNSDIDLQGTNPLTLSSTTNPFSGTLDGDGHTISNLTLAGYDYIGLFGENTGTIKDINITGASMSGNKYIGALVGHNLGTIKGITANANNEGTEAVGIICGYNESNILTVKANGSISGNTMLGLISGQNNWGTIKEAVASGNIISNGDYIGGITGYTNFGTVKSAYIGGSLTGSSYVGKIVGSAYSQTIKSISLDTATINDVAVEGTSLTELNGMSYSAQDLLTQTPYETIDFNFTDETKEYIWYFDNNNLTFRKN